MSKFIVLAIMLVPFLSSAATYHYVATDGETASVEASSAEEAFAKAHDIASNSGVALDMGVMEEGMEVADGTVAGQSGGTGGSNTFHYVTADGYTASVQANDPQTALMIAPNRASNSGVAIDDGVIENGEEVPSVAD